MRLDLPVRFRRPAIRPPDRAAAWLLAAMLVLIGASARAQGPQVDVDDPPGSPTGRGKLGPARGASGTSGFDATPVTSQESIFGGRPGPSATRAPINQLGAPAVPIMRIKPIAQPRSLPEANIPHYGEMEINLNEKFEEGPPDGLTLDQAIDRLVKKNLNLLSLQYEIPMAQADILTAGLRNNPIFYADAQLVPYGHYSNARPGGDTQYDVNVTQPIDVWRKRRARTIVAQRAKRATEAQFQDAVRVQIDNLYTAYVDVLAARLTLKLNNLYAVGLRKLLKLNEDLRGAGFIKPADVLAIKARLELSELQIREATQALAKTLRSLGRLLDLPHAEADQIQPRDAVSNLMALPTTEQALVETGLNARPDLLATRMGLLRAEADVVYARTQRFSDVYLLYQPYTFQNNSWQGLKSAYSYAFGVTVALPLYNRNQGNILRSRLNADQSKVELADQEKQIIFDVEEAVREYELSRNSVIEFRREVLPASFEVKEAAYKRWQGGETSALEYLEAQQEYNGVVRQYSDALVRHRRAMLDLNTAVGSRIIP